VEDGGGNKPLDLIGFCDIGTYNIFLYIVVDVILIIKLRNSRQFRSLPSSPSISTDISIHSALTLSASHPKSDHIPAYIRENGLIL